jgi:phosphatidate cytidylyltransferase
MVHLIIIAGSLNEYYKLVESDTVKPYKMVGIAGGVIIYGVSVSVASGSIPASGYLLLIPVIGCIMISELYRNGSVPFNSIMHTIGGLVYIALPWSMAPFSALNHDSFGTLLPNNLAGFSPAPMLAFFLLLWANDTGAYLAGITMGKHKLFKRVSPKKSWEGFFGGVVATLAVAWAISGWIDITGITGWMIIAVLISVGGTFGDLVESMLKRSAGAKDSGSIFPGHGGFLDRFDSVLFAWPLMYLFITFFG